MMAQKYEFWTDSLTTGLWKQSLPLINLCIHYLTVLSIAQIYVVLVM
jgi:hypothetical protein